MAPRGVFMPAIIDSVNVGSRQAFGGVSRRWRATVGPAMGMWLLLLVCFGDECLQIYGVKFIAAHWVAVLLAATNCVGVICIVLYVRALQSAGQRMKVVVLTAVWYVIGVTAMVILGRLWTDIGIALGNLIGFTGIAVTASIVLRRTLRDEPAEAA